MSKDFSVTPKGIIYKKKLDDSSCSEEIVIPRDVFIEAYEKFISGRNKMKKQYVSKDSDEILVYAEVMPKYHCECGSNEFVHEYDEWRDELFIKCKHCNYTAKLLSEPYIIAALCMGDWRYERIE